MPSVMLSPLGEFLLALGAAAAQGIVAVVSEYGAKTDGFSSLEVSWLAYSSGMAMVIGVGLVSPRTTEMLNAAWMSVPKYKEGDPDGTNSDLWLFLLTCLMDPLTILATFISVSSMDSGDCLALMNSTQVIAGGLIGVLYFGERPNIAVMAVQYLVCIIGILLISQPSFLFGEDSNTSEQLKRMEQDNRLRGGTGDSSLNQESLLEMLYSEEQQGSLSSQSTGMLCACVTGLIMALGNCLIRLLHVKESTKHISVTAIICGSMILGFACLSIVLLCAILFEMDISDRGSSNGIWIDPLSKLSNMLFVPVIGLCLCANEIFDATAFYYGDMNRTTIVVCFSIVCGYIFQIILLDEKESLLSYVGGSVIFLGSIITPLWQILHSDKDAHSSTLHSSNHHSHRNNPHYSYTKIEEVEAVPTGDRRYHL